jgi:tRNA(Arg) A34 adenosine deaminase TadA
MMHEHFMDQVLADSRAALARGDWPVAALVVENGHVIGRGRNEQVTRSDFTWHAETAAIRDALRGERTALSGCTLYAAMEPCPMCAWVIRMAGIDRVVLALRHSTLKRADLGSYDLESFAHMVGWRLEIVDGVREAEYLAIRAPWQAGRAAARSG